MSNIIDYLFDKSNQIIGIPIIIVILATLKAFHYGKTQETENTDDELDSDILNKIDYIVHDHHDASEKIAGFCPHCEKKYMIPPDIGIKVTCPQCHQKNYHNI